MSNDDFVSVLPDKIRHIEARIARLEDARQMEEKRRKKGRNNHDVLYLGIFWGAVVALVLVRTIVPRGRTLDQEMGASFHPSYS